MKKHIFFILLLIGIGCSESNNPVDIETTIEPEIETQVYNLINQYRSSIGQQPLVINQIITEQCRQHSRNMAIGKLPLGHDGFQDRVDNIKSIVALKQAAENVAYNNDNQNPAQTSVTGWLNSQGHKENIEGNFNLTGIGVIKTKEGLYYFTQIFVLSQ